MESFKEENSSWINIADIMAALMMVFMFIAIAFMYELQNEKEIYRVSLNEALHNEFDKDLNSWQAEITDDNIFRFNAPFITGKSELPEFYSDILKDFFPRYINLLTNERFKKEIDEVRVEGHTSYGWNKNSTEEEIYLNNMKLSQDRANNVLTYTYSIKDEVIDKTKEWLQSKLRANGMAFSNLIYEDNNKTIEDKKRSQRVEFKVVTKDHFEKD